MDAPSESTSEAEMRSDEMTTLFPDERAMVGTYCALQMIVFPTDVIAHLCDGFVLRDFLAVAETEIDIACIHLMRIGEALPCHNPKRRRRSSYRIKTLRFAHRPTCKQPCQRIST